MELELDPLRQGYALNNTGYCLGSETVVVIVFRRVDGRVGNVVTSALEILICRGVGDWTRKD